jgi:hypothetical protein
MRFMRFGRVAISLLASGCPASHAPQDSGARADAVGPPADAAADVSTQPQMAPTGADAGPDDALPPSQSEELTSRMRHLLEAVSRDNPELGTDALFPRDAFVAAHDSADPGKAWSAKVEALFRRSVHTIHRRTKGVETAQYVGFELGRTAQQATPKKREWKRPLWRVRHSRVAFTIDGKTSRLDIDEMTSWRGAWYVTKLTPSR